MPSSLHETLVEMFRRWPALAAELLGGVLGVTLPIYEHIRLDASDFTDLTPTEYRSDAVVVLSAAGRSVLAVVIEVQLRPDRQKRWSWPVYLATLRARARCPAVLLVVCVDTATATWCAEPIELGGPGSRMVPLVLGPDRVPVVTDVDEAVRVPELAVLSAMAHGSDPGRRDVLDALVGAFTAVDEDHVLLYSEIVLSALPAAARAYFTEAFMDLSTYEPQSDFWRRRFAEAKAYLAAEAKAEARAEGLAEGLAEGRAEARAAAVLEVLDARGIALSESARSRIVGSSDPDASDRWLRRAATAESVDDLFR